MPKLPVVSGKECCRALTRLGFAEVRQRGSHVVMRRGDLVFATPVLATREVRQVQVARLPGSGEVIVGLFQLRGRTCSLVDIAPIAGPTEALTHAAESLVVVVSASPGDLGLRIDEVIGPRTIFIDEIDEGLDERTLKFVSHMTRDLVHVLDVEALMASPEVRITGRQS